MLGVSRECDVKYLRVMKYCMFGLFEPKKKKNARIRPRGKPSAVVICEIVLVIYSPNSSISYKIYILTKNRNEKDTSHLCSIP